MRPQTTLLTSQKAQPGKFEGVEEDNPHKLGKDEDGVVQQVLEEEIAAREEGVEKDNAQELGRVEDHLESRGQKRNQQLRKRTFKISIRKSWAKRETVWSSVFKKQQRQLTRKKLEKMGKKTRRSYLDRRR